MASLVQSNQVKSKRQGQASERRDTNSNLNRQLTQRHAPLALTVLARLKCNDCALSPANPNFNLPIQNGANDNDDDNTQVYVTDTTTTDGRQTTDKKRVDRKSTNRLKREADESLGRKSSRNKRQEAPGWQWQCNDGASIRRRNSLARIMDQVGRKSLLVLSFIVDASNQKLSSLN